MLISMPRYPEEIWGDGDPRNEQRDLARRYVNKYIHTPKRAPSAMENEGRGRSGCEVITYVRNKYQVYSYIYKYIYYIIYYIYIFLCARSKEAGTVGDEKKQTKKQSLGGSGCKVGTYTYVIYTPTCVHIPLWIIYFSLCADQGRKQAPPASKSRR